MCKYKSDSSRTTGTRSIQKAKIKETSNEKSIISDFNNSLCSINERIKIYLKIDKSDKKLKEDMLRSEIVMLISAVDFYIHEIVKEGIIQIFNKERSATKEYRYFTITLNDAANAIKNKESLNWLRSAIDKSNKYSTFQKFEKIKEAISIIKNEVVNIFVKIATDMNTNYEDLKKDLDYVIKRRNEIAHQCDTDPSSRKRNKINYGDVKKYIELFDKFINKLHNELK